MAREQIIRGAELTTYAGGSGAVLFGLGANELAALIGALVAVIGLAVNIWFRRQHLEIARQVAAEKPDCVNCPERIEAEEKNDD